MRTLEEVRQSNKGKISLLHRLNTPKRMVSKASKEEMEFFKNSIEPISDGVFLRLSEEEAV